MTYKGLMHVLSYKYTQYFGNTKYNDKEMKTVDRLPGGLVGERANSLRWSFGWSGFFRPIIVEVTGFPMNHLFLYNI